jgi:hypothetical protein
MKNILISIFIVILFSDKTFAQRLKADFINQETRCYIWKFNCPNSSTRICEALNEEFSEELAKHCIFIDKANPDEILRHYKMNGDLDSTQIANFLRDELKADFAIILDLKNPEIVRQDYKLIANFISLKDASKIPRSHSLDRDKILQSKYREEIIADLFINQIITKLDCNEMNLISKIKKEKEEFQIPETDFDNFDENNSVVLENIFFLLCKVRKCTEQKENYFIIDEARIGACRILENYLSLCINNLFIKSNATVGKEGKNQEQLSRFTEIVEKQVRLSKIFKKLDDIDEFADKYQEVNIRIEKNRLIIKELQK